MSLKELKKENLLYFNKLSVSDKGSIEDIINYLKTYNIGNYELEMFRKDLIQISIDASERGENFREAIGSSKEFTESILECYKHKPLFERIVLYLYKFMKNLAIYLTIGLFLFYTTGVINITITGIIGGLIVNLGATALEFKLATYLKIIKGKSDLFLNLYTAIVIVALILITRVAGVYDTMELSIPLTPVLVISWGIFAILYALTKALSSKASNE